MDTKEGLHAWMCIVVGRPPEYSPRVDHAAVAAAARARKKQRKAARKARKRNR
jgi:hypothetical protein